MPAANEPSGPTRTRSSPLSALRPPQREVAVAGEVAERVGDQAAAVELDAAQDVRAGAEHEVGAGVDRGVGERPRVAAQLAEGLLVAVGRVRLAGALGAGVHEDDDDVGVARRRGHEGADRAQVADRRGPRVGREAEEGDARARQVAGR